jgi:hypothetical protein
MIQRFLVFGFLNLGLLIASCARNEPASMRILDTARVDIQNIDQSHRATLEVGFTKRGLSSFWIPRLAQAASQTLELCPELQDYLAEGNKVASLRIRVSNKDVSLSPQSQVPGQAGDCLRTQFVEHLPGVDQAQFEIAINLKARQ